MAPEPRHDIVALIKEVLLEEARIDAAHLDEADDLYRAGITSFASVNVMLALEERLDVEFADCMLNRTTFSTIGHLSDALGELLGDAVEGARS